MGESDATRGIIIREGAGTACGDSSCLTLLGAFDDVRKAFLSHHPDGDLSLLNRAFETGRAAHQDQRRKSGEPYFFHPLAVAQYLADWRLDGVSVACGLLHDTVEDTLLTHADVRAQFGDEVAEIVDGLTKISKLTFTDKNFLNSENVRKLVVAMGRDVRVLVIKLADRLHNMKTLGAMPTHKRHAIALETLELYAPLANRLGMGKARSELEDLAFNHLEPERFEELRAAVEAKRDKSQKTIREIQAQFAKGMEEQGLQAIIYGRVKHLFGIWRKLGQNKTLDDIHDWLAYRIIVPDRGACYAALGMVHNLYRPLPNRFKDFISLPKDNGYQSIHTTLLMPNGESFEVQIRTEGMHAAAEAGIAAHWTYKEGRIANLSEIREVGFLRKILELHQEAQDSSELVANLKGELSFSRIQVFTPKGDLKSLPEGATPIDFAYAIHTEVGHHCAGAKVNSRIVPLKYALQSGDRVEILTRPDRKPSRDWLGIVKSASARARIMAFIREEERSHAIQMGKERFEREARNAGVHLGDPAASAVMDMRLKELGLKDWDTYFAGIGFGRYSPNKVLEVIIPEPEKLPQPSKALPPPEGTIVVDDVANVLYYLAQCCKPLPGDDIVGYITKSRGTAIHRVSCLHLNRSTMHPERKVPVGWGKNETGRFPTELTLTTEDRPGMVATISDAINRLNLSMQRFQATTTEEGAGLFHIALLVRSRIHLLEIMASLRKLKGVYTVQRSRTPVFGKIN